MEAGAPDDRMAWLMPACRHAHGHAAPPELTFVELPEGGHCAKLDTRGALSAAVLQFWAVAGEA